MATSSFISKRNSDRASYDGVYCHFDGYPEGVGAILKEHYTDPTKVAKLLDGGSISFLESSLENTRFYHKWRNDPLVIHRELIGRDYLRQVAGNSGCEYLYVFENGQWTVEKL